MNGSSASAACSDGDLSVSTGSAFYQLPAIWQLGNTGKAQSKLWFDKLLQALADRLIQRIDVNGLVPLACWPTMPRGTLCGDFSFFLINRKVLNFS